MLNLFLSTEKKKDWFTGFPVLSLRIPSLFLHTDVTDKVIYEDYSRETKLLGADNQSQQPTVSSVTAGAISSSSLAPAAPAAPAAVLRRYLYRQCSRGPIALKEGLSPGTVGVRQLQGLPGATSKIMTSDGRPTLMPFYCCWMHASN
jgi:hypothetical protein